MRARDTTCVRPGGHVRREPVYLSAVADQAPHDQRIAPGERNGPGPDYVPARDDETRLAAVELIRAEAEQRGGPGEDEMELWLVGRELGLVEGDDGRTFAPLAPGSVLVAARAALSKPTETIAPPRTPVFTREMLERATAELSEGRDVGFVMGVADDGYLRIEEVGHVHPRDFDLTGKVLGREAVTEEMVTRAIDKGLGGDLDGLGDRFVAEFLRPAVRGVLEDILGIDPAPTGGS